VSTDRRQVNSASPFEALFGFCRAHRIGERIFVAGTAPIGPDGETVGVGDPAAQARRCFDIIGVALEELGGSYANVVRTRMFLTDIDDWDAIGRVHGEYFADVQPVSTMVAVARLIDPDWRVEIEAEALLAPE
jgi:enamine deaminase RidA (YjgF/YER057c/UK114 family)